MLVNHELIQHVEDAIAAERSAFADGMAALLPASGAGWLAVAGGRAIFTGAHFFANRAMGLGLHGPVRHDDLMCLETFYATHGVPSQIELASMVDRSLIRVCSERGYLLRRFRNIYAQALSQGHEPAGTPPLNAVEILPVDASHAQVWSTVLLDGFGYKSPEERQRVELWNRMVRTLPGVTALLALLDGQPVGAASVMVLGTTALLGGAATLPEFRRRGVQRALIAARLAIATRVGCELAIVTADPGSSSGRNAERMGFQLLCNHIDLCAPGALPSPLSGHASLIPDETF